MENKKTKIISIASIIALALTLVTATFAYFMAQTGEGKSTDIKINANTVDTFTFATGSAISLSMNQQNFASGTGNQTGSTYAKAMLTANNKTNTATEHYYVYLNISDNTFTYTQDANTPELLLTVKDSSGNAITSITGLTYKTVTDGKGASVSGFDITTKSGLVTLFDNREITTTSSKTEQWNITATFVNYNADQSANAGKSFKSKVLIQKEGFLLTDYVLSQYTGTQGENGIYYHSSTLANGARDNSYRYAGANPNNFVCFGSTTSPCPTDNLYRIIGVFGENYHGVSGKQLVKLIKYDYANSNLLGTDGDYDVSGTPNAQYYKGSLTSIDKYYWNNNTQTNTWSESLLNKTNLNTNFINNIGSTWANKIATTIWKVGGGTFANINYAVPKTAYQYEVGSSASSTTYEAKIGLMYASDYGFGAVSEAWTTTLVNYNGSVNGSTIRSQNWMHMGNTEWTISRDSDDSKSAQNVRGDGNMLNGYMDDGSGVRASFSLESTVTYASGTGTQSDPIRIN